jgi:hypothetical protein
MSQTSVDILRFFKGHWLHALLVVPGAIVVTAFHETAHCLAVWLQGGSITSFECIPSGNKWGEMRYEFPPGVANSDALIAIAPYLASFALCVTTAILASGRRPWSYPIASILFVWLFIVPTADIANAAIPYVLRNADNDLRHAFGEVNPLAWAIGLTAGMLLAAAGYWIQRRLYRERAIRLPAYAILTIAGVFVIVLVTSY